jgi:uncharacterized protein with ATP-grasp and redox domains
MKSFIERIRKIDTQKIVYVARENPIINDVTIDDAATVGLDKVAKVISSGPDAPATILSQFSPHQEHDRPLELSHRVPMCRMCRV